MGHAGQSQTQQASLPILCSENLHTEALLKESAPAVSIHR